MPVAEGVITDRVPGGRDASHQPRFALRTLADREESRMHARLREQIQDLRRPAGIRTVVERQVDGLLAHGSLLSLFKLRTSAVRVSQYNRGSALPRARMRAAGANTLDNNLK